ncbi:response regulator [Paenibacillus sacheonensis]|uniref:Response regulator n=1 Tax=Paenibacillus sacheonensis TaxID=742054 RepID=A0A7X4YUK0_9BACL|nr:response regulator [Paenibacillus sacheonensis]MBM7567258.1 two-component system response regulator YesN [Paenibacillus sacheonensis]NBC72847.1 response regulator [Paenibacillus sacheonensis]
MYRLLIVDDEPIIVEGLFDLFQAYGAFPLEVYRAYDGEEAYEIARRMRIDILLTDIEMPGLNGIELNRSVHRLWPDCRTVFLSGYIDFGYVQASLRGGALDYVLKTEGDEAIIAVVEKAIHQINEQLQVEQLIANAEKQVSAAQPLLRKEYLLELLSGEQSTEASRRQQFAALHIPLQADQPVFLVAGRIDYWRNGIQQKDKTLYTYSVNNIFEEFVSHSYHIVHLPYASDRMLWLVQLRRSNADNGDAMDAGHACRYLLETMESIQSACASYLSLSCSFVVSSQAYGWDAIPARFERISLLFSRGLGLGNEMILSDQHLLSGESRQERTKVKRIHLLGQYLERKEPDKFYALYDEIMHETVDQPSVQSGAALEIFYSLTAIFIAYLNERDLLQRVSSEINVNPLLSFQEHASLRDMSAYFRKLAEKLFEQGKDENAQITNEVVRLVRSYIGDHLSKDLSLERLAQVVHLAPFYLSRLYKQQTGQTISDYIGEIKIARAKQLLTHSAMKIHEVGSEIGYDTSSYFTRFFKNATTFTPQEFRDMQK